MSQRSSQALFQSLKSGFEKEINPSCAVRVDRLVRLKKMLLENEQHFISALMCDYGYRSPDQTAFADITTTIKSANHAIKHVKFWMQPEPRTADISLRMAGARCAVEFAPKGVVGIISPWNFPLNLALSPAVSALAAGNRVFIKPSEMTPHTAELLEKLVAQYFDSAEMTVICGGASVAKEFVSLPFDHLIYTGGTEIARDIMARSAVNLTPLTLELGGKSPVLIDADADLSLAAHRVAFGKYFNAGQICIAPDYVLIQRDLLEGFIAELEKAALHQSSSRISRDHVEIINDRHQQRIAAMLDQATELGADCRVFTDPSTGYSLSVVIADQHCGDISDLEIFGPALLVQAVNDMDEALEKISQHSLPLVIYCFGKNQKTFEKIKSASRSGAIVRNDVIFQYANDDLPFGGIGDSGMGRYRGQDGFKEFSNHRAVYRAGYLDVSGLVTPPYPKLFSTINRIMRAL